MPTPETHLTPGTHGWFGDELWVLKSSLEGRLQQLHAVARYNETMGAPMLAKLRRHEIAHIRGLISGVPA